MTKIIFLDFDGPMLPLRGYITPENKEEVWSQFDPIAVAMVNSLVKEGPAKIVISSAWRSFGKDEIMDKLSKNNISPSSVHVDWCTPRKPHSLRRAEEVLLWVKDHSEITHWVAIDDEPCNEFTQDNWVQVTFDDGIQFEHFQKAREILGVDTKKVNNLWVAK